MRTLPACWLAVALVAGCTTPHAAPPLPPAPAPLARTPRTLTLGAWHGCQRLDDGRVRCWGSNDRDQLGDGYQPYRATPVPAPMIADVVEVRLGGHVTCVRTRDGRVLCWGAGSAAPMPVAGIDDAVELTADEHNACARRRSGRVACWSQRDRERGVHDVGEIRDAVGLVSPTCFLRKSGAVTCASWDTPPPEPGSTRVAPVVLRGAKRTVPTRPLPAHEPADVVALRAKAGRAVAPCVLDADLTLACRDLPRPAPERVVDLALGQRHTCALTSTGHVTCWGSNDYGQLGGGTAEQVGFQLVTIAGLDDATAIAAGVNHTCVRRASGAIACWGANYSGQLGDGTTHDRRAPVAVTGIADARDIFAGGAHTCAREASGALVCWGWGASGQLGSADAMHVAHAAPVVVTGVAHATAIASGASHTCALDGDGSIACWGDITSDPGARCTPASGGSMTCFGYGTACGKLWDGRTDAHATPEPITGITGVLELAARGDRTCARDTDGAVRCWTTTERCTASGAVRPGPISAIEIPGAEEIALGGRFTCARRGGAVDCFGSNEFGQLGDGTTTDHAKPAAVPGLDDAVALALGERHACALRAGGRVACWGFNVSGQLGDGTTVEKHTPTSVLGLDDAQEIAAGSHHTCARRAGGEVVCWGENDFASIGDGTKDDRLVPTPVLGIAGAVEIAAATDSTCARLRSGSIACWGSLAEKSLKPIVMAGPIDAPPREQPASAR
ncbi:BNR repeat domain protein [Minicystis rosea]|nr:BNR repeat domain protein [Minicystis rosea]